MEAAYKGAETWYSKVDNPKEQDTLKRVYEFPTSQIKLNNKKSSYYDVINSLAYKECNDALIKIYERINMKDIYIIIDEVEFLSNIHKEFLKHILNKRYEIIIKASYDKLMESNNE